MGTTKIYLLALSTLMIVCFCAGAKLRLKRSEGGNESNLDANGLCITARNWKNDCNTCWCEAKGVPACTLIGCIHASTIITAPKEPEREQMAVNVEKKCVPGTKWDEDCNSCWCTDDGVSICTKVGCGKLGNI